MHVLLICIEAFWFTLTVQNGLPTNKAAAVSWGGYTQIGEKYNDAAERPKMLVCALRQTGKSCHCDGCKVALNVESERHIRILYINCINFRKIAYNLGTWCNRYLACGPIWWKSPGKLSSAGVVANVKLQQCPRDLERKVIAKRVNLRTVKLSRKLPSRARQFSM